mmetsp:Transcript_34243/g.67425  ORF Transcript_34243/g.67425 Transcript_34243/m.67425 type:complete len:181 (+) Transcript_34243:103-645(+)
MGVCCVGKDKEALEALTPKLPPQPAVGTDHPKHLPRPAAGAGDEPFPEPNTEEADADASPEDLEQLIDKKQSEDLRAKADANGDGKIDWEEAQALGISKEDFDKMDTNGDGGIDKAEWEASLATKERRIDPADGKAYTKEEIAIFYKGKYKKKEIDEYWAKTMWKPKAGDVKGKTKKKRR